MTADGLTEAEVAALLAPTRRVAVVGASPRPDRASNEVFGRLAASGLDAVPVNPAACGQSVHGRLVVATLAEAAPLDIVDIFRRAEDVGPVVDEAIRLGARVIWMQLGIVAPDAAARARAAGIAVVMDRCLGVDWGRLGPARPATDATPAA